MGLDGGGSKTTALIGDASGRVLGRAEASTSNHHVVGWDAAFAQVAAAIERAKAAAGFADRALQVVCLGVAGADTPEDHDKFVNWMHRKRLAKTVRVVNDGALLLAAAGQSPGVAVVSGTGSIAWGQDANGRQARAGGWGHLIGDEGSGYDLSVQALRLTVRAADGRQAWGPLPKAVLRALKVKQARDLLPFVYGPTTAKSDLAKLAPVVFRLAAREEPQACALVQNAARALGELVRAVSLNLKLKRPAVAFGGSLLARQALLRDALVQQLPFTPRSVSVVKEPAQGALLLARQASG